jgi:hypothetical protein
VLHERRPAHGRAPWLGLVALGIAACGGEPRQLLTAPPGETVATISQAILYPTSFVGASLFTAPFELLIGNSVSSDNGKARLSMDTSGSLALYDEHGFRRWSTPTTTGTRARFQTDGNLVVYSFYTDPQHAKWASHTNGNAGAVLALQRDGNLVIYKPVWASHTNHISFPRFVPADLYVAPFDLQADEMIFTNNFAITLKMNDSGDLVDHDEHGVLRWHTNTNANGPGTIFNTAEFLTNGDFLVDPYPGIPDPMLWSTHTADKPGSVFALQHDGNIVIYQPIWATHTNH